jgi:hypothetical protein
MYMVIESKSIKIHTFKVDSILTVDSKSIKV